MNKKNKKEKSIKVEKSLYKNNRVSKVDRIVFLIDELTNLNPDLSSNLIQELKNWDRIIEMDIS